ncbi:MAG: SCO family protein [Rhodospirillales bacterium]|nr:SCO family protein [Rhodospirillales bacterium]
MRHTGSCGALSFLAFAIAFMGLTDNLRASEAVFDDAAAISRSQAAIGRSVGDHEFRDTGSRKVRLSDFRGRPLVLNFIYTSCPSSCNVTTVMLEDAFEVARDALGRDEFAAVSIGFDTAKDTPERMRLFARQKGVEGTYGWQFLSGDAETIEALTKTLGFVFFRSPQGYDHLAQVTVIDAQGKVFRQIYGESFDIPLLVEPLRALVFGTSAPFASFENLVKKVRLFCTIYDPAADRYRFDYSLFIQLSAGILIIGGGFAWVCRELWRNRRRRRKETPVL